MVRNARPKGVYSTPFGLCLFVFTAMPTQIGYQDVASLIARQPSVTAFWRQHIRASAFGTIHAATFSFALPVGTGAPRPLSARLTSIDPRLVTPAPWSGAPAEADDPPLDFPKVDRTAKGDRERVLNPSPAKPPATAADPAASAANADKTVSEMKADPGETADTAEDIPDPLDAIVGKGVDAAQPAPADPVIDIAALHLRKEAPTEEAVDITPIAPASPDIKLSALEPAPKAAETKAGESIAPKGQVTGEGKRPMTPAERLKLEGKSRAAAEKCLADAIYFESRGEAVRGQIAVAQVVMNRVFSGYYPRSVCGTVYQNKHRRLACQFTFACDGIPDVVTEPHAWLRATRIARDVLDGKYWLPEVDRATHYHAYWVRPSWVREMKRLYKFGVHTFYRPRAWGDGADTPSWGTAEATKEAIAKL